MTIRQPIFLPSVPEDLVRAALSKAGGNEIDSGKLDSSESSAALAVSAFGWCIERPADLPPFPPLTDLNWPAMRGDVERQMRFPWSGGRHPWLDAPIETPGHVIGIEAKRFVPFRHVKTVSLSNGYDRDVWGDRMAPLTAMRDALRVGTVIFGHLDGAQLVKHAFGLVTEGRRLGKAPVLLHLYVEPTQRGEAISADALARHRAEVQAFANAVAGTEVRFAHCSCHGWLTGCTHSTRSHADAIIASFELEA